MKQSSWHNLIISSSRPHISPKKFVPMKNFFSKEFPEQKHNTESNIAIQQLDKQLYSQLMSSKRVTDDFKTKELHECMKLFRRGTTQVMHFRSFSFARMLLEQLKTLFHQPPQRPSKNVLSINFFFKISSSKNGLLSPCSGTHALSRIVNTNITLIQSIHGVKTRRI